MAEIRLSRFAGLKNTVPVERLNDGFRRPGQPESDVTPADLIVADNVDIDDSFGLAVRPGIELKNAAIATSLWSNGETALFVGSNNLYRLNKDFSETLLVSDVGDTICCLQISDRIFWSDGLEATGVIESGANRSWGLPIPDDITISPASGQMAAGSYLVSLSYVRDSFIEGGASFPVRIDLPENSGIRINWTDVPDEVAYIRMYCSQVNGDVLYKALDVRSSVLAATYTGGVLGYVIDTFLLEPPIPGHLMTWYKGRIYTASDVFLFATNPYGYELMDLREFMPVDGTRINMLMAVDGGIYVGTDNGVSFLTGTTFADFSITRIRDSAVIPGTAIYADGEKVTGNIEFSGIDVVLFCTDAGVVLGMPDGKLINLTYDRYRFNPGQFGAAIFKDTEINHQYLLFTR